MSDCVPPSKDAMFKIAGQRTQRFHMLQRFQRQRYPGWSVSPLPPYYITLIKRIIRVRVKDSKTIFHENYFWRMSICVFPFEEALINMYSMLRVLVFKIYRLFDSSIMIHYTKEHGLETRQKSLMYVFVQFVSRQ